MNTWRKRKVALAAIGTAVIAVTSFLANVTQIAGFPIQLGWFRSGQPAQSAQSEKSSMLPSGARRSEQETEAWNRAMANRADCDAIRQYLLDYPTGQFVGAAQTILGARREMTEKQWVAFEFPSSVVASSALDGRDSREAACASAREQMMRNIEEGCGAFRDQSSRYRSVKAIASRNSDCECRDEAIQLGDQAPTPLWRCSVRATYSCRGETVQLAKRFTCN